MRARPKQRCVRGFCGTHGTHSCGHLRHCCARTARCQMEHAVAQRAALEMLGELAREFLLLGRDLLLRYDLLLRHNLLLHDNLFHFGRNLFWLNLYLLFLAVASFVVYLVRFRELGRDHRLPAWRSYLDKILECYECLSV